MDGFHTDGNENGIAIIDRHTGFIWARKTGDQKTGTTKVIMKIFRESQDEFPPGENIFVKITPP